MDAGSSVRGAKAGAALSLGYHAEIDGLRAVAVLPVVMFHAGFSAFSGGYLGVDVFFVISGYLITSLLLRDITQGRFSIPTFYARRARRILPALIFVALCTIPLAAIFLFPWQIANYGHSITATMGFYANQYFLGTVDYFHEGADGLPLLHMWSLAIEEQYYLLVPLLLWLVWAVGMRRRALFGMILVASLLSLVGAVVIVTRYPATAFYILPTRAFELGVGSLLAVALLGRARPDTRANGALACLGLAMILAPIFLLPSDALLPSWLSLAPCVGTALVIAFASTGTSVHRLLASRIFVGIGLFSFSLYLWHQPLFAFARAATPHPSAALMGGLAAASVALGWATWKFIEKPTRRARLGRGRVLILAGASLLVMAAAGQLVATAAHRLHLVAPGDRQLAVSSADRGAYLTTRYNRLPTGFDGAPVGPPRLLLIGDSHSQDFYNLILEAGAFPGWTVAKRYIPAACQTHFGTEDVSAFISPGDRRRCAGRRDFEVARAVARDADLVIFVSAWVPWSAERAKGSVAALGLAAGQKVLVVGVKGLGPVFLPGFVGKNPDELAAVAVSPPPDVVAANHTLRKTLPSDMFVDIGAVVCPDGRCPLFTAKGDLISHDGGHLTKVGAKSVGIALFRHPLLSPFLGAGEGAALKARETSQVRAPVEFGVKAGAVSQ